VRQKGKQRFFLDYSSGSLTKVCRPSLSDTLTVCTDDPQHPIQFSIYGYLITTSTSHILKSLFNDPRARAKGIVLHDTKANTLRGYVHWLHTRQFLSKKPEGFNSYSELIDFYLLGEILKDQTFCQQAIDAVIVLRYDGRKWPGHQITNEIWERTSPDSPLRKVMKELWMSTNVDKAMRYLKTAPEPGYHRDVILSLLEELISRGVFVKEATFSGRSRKEVEDVCCKFVQGMKVD
jgi:hypothetical protein